jgi:hypothetical protein
MKDLSDLERAVLLAIADQHPEHRAALRQQVSSASVAQRENTGAGFYTKLRITEGPRLEGAPSPLGDVGAKVDGLTHGMGFLLWLEDGMAETLEGYTYDDETAGLELASLRGSNVGPRLG